MSETSPPKPTTLFSAKVRRRLTSGKRAREPYDAVRGGKDAYVSYLDGGCMGVMASEGKEGFVPRLSAAMTTPSLNFRATTDVPVTTGDCVWVVGPLGRMYDAL
jgi:hypothetical protein